MNTVTTSRKNRNILYSIGVNAKGSPTLYMIIDGSFVEIPTTIVGFADLAALGVPVTNGRP